MLWIVLFQSLAAPALAESPPEESRPYLELPFPGESAYEVTCAYECYQHHGSMVYAVDFAIPEGDPIVAAAPGVVLAITWEVGLPVSLNLGDALIVYIDHGSGWFTRYVHLSGVTVSVGDQVEMGDVIGYSGMTGASGDHLHFELKYGTSLHSPSVPIDELFGGEAPVAGSSYTSNNLALLLQEAKLESMVPPPGLTPQATMPALDLLPTATALPTVAAEQLPLTDTAAAEAVDVLLPEVAVGLVLSSPTVRAGEPVTASFTIRNTSQERLTLTVLGVGSRAAGSEQFSEVDLHFDRNIILNPDRTYRFSRVLTFHEGGEEELFAFALGPENEWIPLGGATQSARLTVEGQTYTYYLPTVRR